MEQDRASKTAALNVVAFNGGTPRELVRVSGVTNLNNFTVWTPDGGQIIFEQTKDGENSSWIVPVNGGVTRQLDPTFPTSRQIRIHPDGRRIVYDTGNNVFEVWVLERFLRPLAAGTSANVNLSR